MPSVYGRGTKFIGVVGTLNSKFVERRPATQFVLSGVTRDRLGAILGGCTVEAYETIPGVAKFGEPKGRFVGNAISDATTGAYSIEVHTAKGATFILHAYLAGSPDVSGITVNSLVGILKTTP